MNQHQKSSVSVHTMSCYCLWHQDTQMQGSQSHKYILETKMTIHQSKSKMFREHSKLRGKLTAKSH